MFADNLDTRISSSCTTVEPRLTDTPQKRTAMHDITDNSESPDCPPIHFDT